MLKVLDYTQAYGSQDRDDTILVAKLVPPHSDDSQRMEGPGAALVVDQHDTEYVEAKDIVVAQAPHSPGASGSEEGPMGTVVV